MLLNDHGSVSPVVPTEGLRGQLAWWSLALHRQPTGPRTQLGTPPTPGARVRPCGATGPRGSGEALPFHRGPQAQGKRCPSTGGPQAQGRPYPSTGNHALTWRPYPSTRGPWAHTDARHVHRGNPGFTWRPRRPLPAPGPPHARHTSLVPAAATPQFRTARTQRLRSSEAECQQFQTHRDKAPGIHQSG